MSRKWYQGLLCKFPTFDPAWPPGVAAAWWECFAAMQAVARKTDQGTSEAVINLGSS